MLQTDITETESSEALPAPAPVGPNQVLQNLTILMPSGVVAILRIPVPFTPEDLEALCAQLDAWKKVIGGERPGFVARP